MRKLLLSLGVFTFIVLLSSFSLSSEEQLNISEVDLSMKHASEYETNSFNDALSRKYVKDTIREKFEEVDYYEIDISVKLPSGEEVGFFQKSISSKYTSGKGEWEKWTTTSSGAHNHRKVLEKLEEVLRKY